MLREVYKGLVRTKALWHSSWKPAAPHRFSMGLSDRAATSMHLQTGFAVVFPHCCSQCGSSWCKAAICKGWDFQPPAAVALPFQTLTLLLSLWLFACSSQLGSSSLFPTSIHFSLAGALPHANPNKISPPCSSLGFNTAPE